jgi:hypothetical protein
VRLAGGFSLFFQRASPSGKDGPPPVVAPLHGDDGCIPRSAQRVSGSLRASPIRIRHEELGPREGLLHHSRGVSDWFHGPCWLSRHQLVCVTMRPTRVVTPGGCQTGCMGHTVPIQGVISLVICYL